MWLPTFQQKSVVMSALSLKCNQSLGKPSQAPHLTFRMVHSFTLWPTVSGKAHQKEPSGHFCLQSTCPLQPTIKPRLLLLQTGICEEMCIWAESQWDSACLIHLAGTLHYWRCGKTSHCLLQMTRLLLSHRMGPVILFHHGLATLSSHPRCSTLLPNALEVPTARSSSDHNIKAPSVDLAISELHYMWTIIVSSLAYS